MYKAYLREPQKETLKLGSLLDGMKRLEKSGRFFHAIVYSATREGKKTAAGELSPGHETDE